jgi:hypothetical protein
MQSARAWSSGNAARMICWIRTCDSEREPCAGVTHTPIAKSAERTASNFTRTRSAADGRASSPRHDDSEHDQRSGARRASRARRTGDTGSSTSLPLAPSTTTSQALRGPPTLRRKSEIVTSSDGEARLAARHRVQLTEIQRPRIARAPLRAQTLARPPLQPAEDNVASNVEMNIAPRATARARPNLRRRHVVAKLERGQAVTSSPSCTAGSA